LDEIVTRMDGAMQIQNTRLWSELNILFHRTIAEISHMSLLAEFTNRVLDQWMRFSRYFFTQIGTLRMEQAQSEHRQILEWLQMQDIGSLEKMAESHNHLALLAYQELLENEEFGI